MTFRVLSLFSGIGGIDYAFEAAGFHIVEQVEINEFCQSVLKKHWPGVPKHRDIFDYRGQRSAADVITAGFPCQPFSVAGKQRGAADERFLWPELYRVICEVRPTIVFLENVPDLRTNDAGRTFKHILWQLAEIGYDAEWGHLQAAHVGAPHRRERLFIVAYAANCGGQNEPCGIAGETLVGAITDADNRVSGRHSATRVSVSTGDQGQVETVGDSTVPRLEESEQPPGRTNGAETGARLESQSQRRDQIVANAQQFRPPVDPSSQTRPAFRYQQRHDQAAQCQRHQQQSGVARAGFGSTESRVGRSTDGLSVQLVGHRFPAGQSAFQHEWEPPRTATGVKARTAQIKALGNAVVPQCVYPIALAIREWLEAQP